MAGTGVWLVSWTPAAEDRISGAARRPGRSRRSAGRLWVFLHAQALLRGTADGWDDAAVIEDDYRRMAAQRLT
jgi:hypothetical protein